MPRISFSSTSFIDLNKTDLDEIRNNKWRLDCPWIRIISRKPTDPETYEGPGLIWFSEEGRLLFRQYSVREENTKQWNFRTPAEAGQVIPDRSFYDLAATDANGREWTSERLIPNTHRVATGNVIVSGALSEIVSGGKYPEDLNLAGATLDYWIFHDLPFPANATTIRRESTARGKLRSTSGTTNAWRFRSQAMSFLLIRRSEHDCTIRVTATRVPHNPAFPRRIAESFQLLLGTPLAWGVMKYREGNQVKLFISSKRAPLRSGRFQPPLPTSQLQYGGGKHTSEYHRRLFNKYLRAVLDESARRSSIWGLVNAIYEASSSRFLDAEALTLTVAIESLLHNEFQSIGGLSDEETSALDDLRAHIGSWEGNAKLKKRIIGFFDTIASPRAVDRMRELSNRKLISEDQSKAWERVRNLSTHAYQSVRIESREFISLIQKCHVLFYHLVFISIGYKGPYMDVASRGWPIRSFPGNRLWR